MIGLIVAVIVFALIWVTTVVLGSRLPKGSRRYSELSPREKFSGGICGLAQFLIFVCIMFAFALGEAGERAASIAVTVCVVGLVVLYFFEYQKILQARRR